MEPMQDSVASQQPDGLGFYVHIPFCQSKCSYCDFLSFPVQKEGAECLSAYVSALCAEIATLPLLNTEIDSIFFGGGTPSLLPAEALERILHSIEERYRISPAAEISLECNPGSADALTLRGYRRAGVNRLSFGLQSLDAAVLARIGRIHNAWDFWQSLDGARWAGFEHINVDVMAGLPGQSAASLLSTLEPLIQADIEHISLYALILEDGTPMEREVSQGRLRLPDEGAALDMQRRAISLLTAAGFGRYEISNFAKPGRECRHNVNVWKGGAYLAAGLGASSALYLKNGSLLRCKNTVDMDQYLQQTQKSASPIRWHECVSVEEQRFESIMLGLRLCDGIEDAVFRDKFSRSLMETYPQAIHKHVSAGFLSWDGARLQMTDKGLEWQNTVLMDFLDD